MIRPLLLTVILALAVPPTAGAWSTLPDPFHWHKPEPRVVPIDVFMPPAVSKSNLWADSPEGGSSVGFWGWPHNRPYRVVVWYDRVARSVLLSCQGHARASFVVRAGRDLFVVTRPHPDQRKARVRCAFDGRRRLVLGGVPVGDTVEVGGRIVAERLR